jgi:hypothetical protein
LKPAGNDKATQKSSKKLMAGTIKEEKKGKAKERPKDAQPT